MKVLRRMRERPGRRFDSQAAAGLLNRSFEFLRLGAECGVHGGTAEKDHGDGQTIAGIFSGAFCSPPSVKRREDRGGEPYCPPST